MTVKHAPGIHDTHPDRPDVVDLRSDTFTQPTDEMREAMAHAAVGDDLFDEDPTMHRLEAAAARRLGKEAAMFVPTGSMGNLLAIFAHTGGDKEIIAERRAHIFTHETGSVHALARCGMWPIDAPGGVFLPDTLEAVLRPTNFTQATQGLVVVENSVGGWSGAVWRPDETAAVAEVAHRHDLPLHVDGARIFNAAVAQETSADRLVAAADSVMFCFSKGLSAPVGSVLVGDAAFIERAIPYRKRLGGAMRQAGHLAAAAEVALEQMVDRLSDDHAHAKRLAEHLDGLGYGIDPARCPTNILHVDVRPAGWKDADAFVQAAEHQGLLVLADSPFEVRFVTHRHITDEKTKRALDILTELQPGDRGAAPPARPSGRRADTRT